MTRTPHSMSMGLFLAAAVCLLPACAQRPPVLEPAPEIRAIPERQAPEELNLSRRIVFPRKSTDPSRLLDNVTSRASYSVPADARVVISVPLEEQAREERQRSARSSALGTATSATDNEGITSFKTTGYFNKAEQQIEKSLISKNFVVLDRSKFEAKLRDERAEHLYSRSSRAKEAELEAAEQKKSSGELSVDEWADEVSRIEKKYGDRDEGGGRYPGQPKELVDNSELIRAAQSGEVQADYILQVNTFKTDALSDSVIHLTDLPELASLCDENPGLRTAIEEAGQGTIAKPGFYGLLNAKLIEVQTGAIVWVGDHRVESQNVLEDGFRLYVPVTKRVANAAEVNAAIREHNAQLTQLRAACDDAQRAVEGGELPPVLVEARVEDYERLRAELTRRLEAGPPAEATAPWRFEYIVEPVEVRPDLPTSEVLARLDAEWQTSAADPERRARLRQDALRFREFLNSHYSELAKLVAKELIATIPSHAE